MANVLKALLARLNQSAVAVVPLALLGGAAYGVKESIYTGAPSPPPALPPPLSPAAKLTDVSGCGSARVAVAVERCG
jgi:hypothetical protein